MLTTHYFISIKISDPNISKHLIFFHWKRRAQEKIITTENDLQLGYLRKKTNTFYINQEKKKTTEYNKL